MRNLVFAAAAVSGLVAAGAAVAHGIEGGAKSITPVSGTFRATTVRESTTQSCTSSTGTTIATTKATYAGTSSGAPDLTGSATIFARSTINTTDGIGIVTGTFKVGKTEGRFSAVYDHGAIAGTAAGHGATPHTQLLANLSASYSPTAGFTGGKIGGTSGGSAVEFVAGGCAPSHPPQAEKTSAHGTVTASSATSITVAGLTCAVPPSLGAPVLINYYVGAHAAITCAVINGVKTLVTIDKSP
jgi:hypothetical protein